MKKDTVIALKKPEHIAEDPLMEILRKGAREMLKAALEAEVDSFLERFEEVKDATGKRMVTRNAYPTGENNSNRTRRHSCESAESR